MKHRILTTTAISLAVYGALLVPTVRADEGDEMTTVTFSEPVEVPGTVLPAGTYVFKLMDSAGDRNNVEIFNADAKHLITMVQAIPDYRLTTPGKTIFSFNKKPSGQPESVKAWFYPGDNCGLEFVYPKQEPMQSAKSDKQPVAFHGE